MTKRKKRISPTERLPLAEAKRAYPIQLTERDIDLIEWLALVREATTGQIKRLYFPGNWSTCTRRLQLLFQNQLIWRDKVDLRKFGFTERSQKETLIHTLDARGAMVLAQRSEVPVEMIWRPSDRKVNEQQLYHSIVNNDVRVAVKLAVEALGFTVEQWETDESFRRKPVDQRWIVDFMPSYDGAEVETESEIIPDDFLTIVTLDRRYHCIIEVDTGTEVRQARQRPRGKDTSIATKIRRYISFLHKEKRNEPSLLEKMTGQEQKGIRVFFITTGGEDAVNNLLACIKQVGGKNTYWVARYDLARREDLVLTRPIWRKAGDNELAYYPWIGMSKLEEVRHRLRQYGVEPDEIEARITSIVNLARSQVSDGWSEEKPDMSLEQAVALRSDEIAEAILRLFTDQVAAKEERG